MLPVADPTTEFASTAAPRDVKRLLSHPTTRLHEPVPVQVSSMGCTETELAKRIQAYALDVLPAPIYHHSMRVFHYGIAIRAQQFPEWAWSVRAEETYFLTCMFHDVGLKRESLRNTRLSFEFWGGFNAIEVLRDEKFGGDMDQAESVAEAIIRHNDFGDKGNITQLGLILQLATTFDNNGSNAFMMHPDTIDNIICAYPRLHWNSCVTEGVQGEMEIKPWSHLTKYEPVDEYFREFRENKFMAKYDNVDSATVTCICGHFGENPVQ